MMDSQHVSHSAFKVTIEGESLNEHMISVEDLIPALQGANELILKSNEILNSKAASAILRVRPPEPGCFDIGFVISVVQTAAMLGTGDPVTSAVNLQRLLFGGNAPGVLGVLKWLKGRSFNVITDKSDDQIIVEAKQLNVPGVLEAEDLRVQIPRGAYELLKDPEIRKQVSQFASPLKRNGIDSMLVQGEQIESAVYSEEDLAYFEPLERTEDSGIVSEAVSRQLLKIESPHLGPRDRQWRLHDGNKSNLYSIRDLIFLEEVRKGERVFTAGDVLDCEVRIEQILTGEDLRTKLEVLRVYSHDSPVNFGRQLRF